MDPLQPQDPTELGGWKIIARLASSENSKIYLGHKGIEGLEQAAIKVLSEEISGDLNAIDRLKIEAEALKKISNPYITKLVDYNFESKPAWIATEYIDRKTLDAKLKQDGKPIAGQEWWQLAAKIFNGLKAIHSEKIIHKDIKPANIIYAGEQVKIIDFGISYVPGNTGKIDFSTMQFEGSRPFAAPENFTGQDSEKMDVFSAAVTLAYAGRLRSIWNDENENTLSNSVFKGKPDLSGLEPEQIELLEPLLDKYPSKRPSSEEAFNKIAQYIEYLVGKSEGKPRPLKGSSLAYRFMQNKSFKMASIASTILMIFVLTLSNSGFREKMSDYLGSEKKSLAVECRTTLQNGKLDLAIETCSKSVKAGNIDSKIYLSRAYKAKGSDSQAKSILLECKDENVGCLSDYAHFYETGAQKIVSLESALKNGDSEAAWRLGLDYQNNGDIKTAISWYEKASKEENAVANVLLATYLSTKTNEYSKALTYAKQAINGDLSALPALLKVDHPVERLIEAIYSGVKDSRGKIDYFSDCADKKVVICVSILASTFLGENDYVNASKYGNIGAELQDPESMYVLAQVAAQKNTSLPKGTNDPAIDKEIMGWYQKAADLGDVKSMGAMALAYSFGVGGFKTDFRQSCIWYQRQMAAIESRKGSYLEDINDEKDYRQAAQFFQLQTCQNILLNGAPALSFDSPSPAPTKNKNPVPSPSPSAKISDSNLTPQLRYESSEYSEKVSTNVKTSSIFGRAYLSGLSWIIPLTNSANESVPPINRVQFRNSTLPYGSWWNLPYTLKDRGSLGWQAEVSEIGIQLLHSTGDKVCPEFRLALVQDGLVTYIWSKSVAPCT